MLVDNAFLCTLACGASIARATYGVCGGVKGSIYLVRIDSACHGVYDLVKKDVYNICCCCCCCVCHWKM